MKSPPRADVDPGVAGAGLLDELSVAVRAGRLVALLKGDGLNQGTVEELLRPEKQDGQAARLGLLFGTEER